MDLKFQCTFCEKRFVHEGRYIKHRCRELVRDEEIRTPRGQAAFAHYKRWMKEHKRAAPNPAAFLTSKFYNAFMKFVDFAQRIKIADVDTYIMLMSSDGISPTMWTLDGAYTRYIEFMDRRTSPYKHVSITIDTITSLEDQYGVSSGEVFNVVPPAEVIQLLHQRRLTPWILLKSSKFKQFYIDSCSGEERMIIDSIIRPTTWKDKFDKNPKLTDEMRTFVNELSL